MKKTISFSVEGRIKVPAEATKEEVEEALRFYFDISDTMSVDNPIDIGVTDDSDFTYDSVDINYWI